MRAAAEFPAKYSTKGEGKSFAGLYNIQRRHSTANSPLPPTNFSCKASRRSIVMQT